MKKLFLFSFTLLNYLTINAQIVDIPDEILKKLLTQNVTINTNGDNEIQVSEAESFDGYLDLAADFLTFEVINNFQGIEAFVNITGLNVSGNFYFGDLDFSSNTELTELAIGGNNFIQNINISQNTKLITLDVNAITAIESLDVTHLIDLEDLNIKHTDFATIDLSQNLKLKELDFFASEISSIDLSNNIALENLSTGGSNLDVLDITNNINLTYLEMQSSTYSTIDLSKNINLESIACYGSQIESFDFSNNINLKSIGCGNNIFTQLDFSNNPKFERFVSQGNENLEYLNIANGNNENFSYFSANDSPNLSTVCVDNVQYAVTNFINIDDSAVFSICEKEPVVYIPDTNFKTVLLNNSTINANQDQEIQFSEAEAFTGQIGAREKDINDITGVEAFINLKSISLDNNNLTQVDFSKNIKLEYIYINNNLLQNLDTSNLPILKSVTCTNNVLESLDFSSNPLLNYLLCWSNDLTHLDISKNILLENVACTYNENLKELILPESDVLNKIAITFTAIESLDLSHLENLKQFSASFSNLKEIDFSNNSKLEIVNLSFSSQLEFINIKNGANELIIDNPVVNSDGFQAKNCDMLTSICVDDVQYAITNFINIDDSTVFNSCEEESVVDIPDTHFKSLVVNNNEINTNGDSEIQTSEAESFDGYLDLAADIFTIGDIKNFQGIEAFVNITGLNVSGNFYLGDLDFSSNTELTELAISGNNFIQNINISQNTKLIILDVSSSSIESLDVTHLINLEDLNLRHTDFATIDLSQNLKLKELTFFASEISSIDLSNNISLEGLTAGSNLDKLDITNNINLTRLSIQSSTYGSIDLTQNINLESIACYGSQIEGFDFSNNINLKSIGCGNNIFTQLDFSNNPKFERFVSQGNENLEYLNIANGNNANFSYFSANDSPNLLTVCVDDVEYAISNFTNIDDSTVFNNCEEETGTNCEDIQYWSADETYSEAGTQVVYNNIIYENKWYSKNQNPEAYSKNTWDLWTLIGECNSAKSLSNDLINSRINVYPNLFTDNINVDIDYTDQKIGSLQLLDFSGKTIVNQKGTNLNNLSTIDSGMYLLKILDTNNQILAIQKVFKQ